MRPGLLPKAIIWRYKQAGMFESKAQRPAARNDDMI